MRHTDKAEDRPARPSRSAPEVAQQQTGLSSPPDNENKTKTLEKQEAHSSALASSATSGTSNTTLGRTTQSGDTNTTRARLFTSSSTAPTDQTVASVAPGAVRVDSSGRTPLGGDQNDGNTISAPMTTRMSSMPMIQAHLVEEEENRAQNPNEVKPMEAPLATAEPMPENNGNEDRSKLLFGFLPISYAVLLLIIVILSMVGTTLGVVLANQDKSSSNPDASSSEATQNPTMAPPTTAPTMMLLPPPTDPPSMEEITFTDSPSSRSPTTTPSGVPSRSPTSMPTRLPSVTPTRSPQPSQRPTFDELFATQSQMPLPLELQEKEDDTFGHTLRVDSLTGKVMAIANETAVWIFRKEDAPVGLPSWTTNENVPVLHVPGTFPLGSGGRRQSLDILLLPDETVVVSVALTTSVYVYQHGQTAGTDWTLMDSFVDTLSDEYGSLATRLALSSDGQVRVAIATTATTGPEGDAGYTALYQYNSAAQFELVGNERIPGFHSYTYSKFLALLAGGDIIAVGNPSEIGTGQVRVYTSNTGIWSGSPSSAGLSYWHDMGQPLVGGDYEDIFGEAISLTSSNSENAFFGKIRLAIGAPGIIQCSGSGCFVVRVYEFLESTNRWLQEGQVLQLDSDIGFSGDFGSWPQYGHQVAFGQGGNNLVVSWIGFDYRFPECGLDVWEWDSSIWRRQRTWTGQVHNPVHDAFFAFDLVTAPAAAPGEEPDMTLVLSLPRNDTHSPITIWDNY